MTIDQLSQPSTHNQTTTDEFERVVADALDIFYDQEDYIDTEVMPDTTDVYGVSRAAESITKVEDAIAELGATHIEQIELSASCASSVEYLDDVATSLKNMESMLHGAIINIESSRDTIAKLGMYTRVATGNTKQSLNNANKEKIVLEQLAEELGILMMEREALQMQIFATEGIIASRANIAQSLPNVASHNAATRKLDQKHIDKRKNALPGLLERLNELDQEIQTLISKIEDVANSLKNKTDTYIGKSRQITEERLAKSGKSLHSAEETIAQVGAVVNQNQVIATAVFDSMLTRKQIESA